jgi:UDP-glucose 4-epimerase
MEQGETSITQAIEYNSHNTTRLDIGGMQTLLMKLRFIQASMHGEQIEAEE